MHDTASLHPAIGLVVHVSKRDVLFCKLAEVHIAAEVQQQNMPPLYAASVSECCSAYSELWMYCPRVPVKILNTT
jgi:hypothetical protein